MKIKCDDKYDHQPVIETTKMPSKYKNIYNSAQALFYAKKYANKKSDKIYKDLDKAPIIVRTVARKYTK